MAEQHYRLKTIDTKLPVRAMKVTICDMCHEATAIMFDVYTNTLSAQPAFWTPLVDQGLSKRCERCRRRIKAGIIARQWLLEPNFLDFADVRRDAERFSRMDEDAKREYLEGKWLNSEKDDGSI